MSGKAYEGIPILGSSLPNVGTVPDYEDSEPKKHNETIVRCFTCRSNLWSIKKKDAIIKKALVVETSCIEPNKMPMDRAFNRCPICGKEIWLERDKEIIFLTNRGEVIKNI